jgi:regulator of chromosome condensation
MPPRRSARASSAKPAASAPEKPKLEPRSRSRPPKRPASPEQSQSPPPVAKRPRTTAKEAHNGIAKDHDVDHPPKVNGKAATKTTKLPVVSVQSKPYFNSLPTPPEHSRPALQLFVWGAGNFGQFGMGEDELGEYPKPKMNKWVKEGMEEKRFGDEEGAGLEAVAAGGLHTLFIDEKGVVCVLTLPIQSLSH